MELITTDSFLYPNAVLEAKGIMHRKGFPESYDRRALVRFVAEVKAGAPEVRAPVYSHLEYDIVPGAAQTVQSPDIFIIEGLNVLQPAPPTSLAVNDYFDFSIYVDAKVEDVRDWYVDRFHKLRRTAFEDPKSYFRYIAELSERRPPSSRSTSGVTSTSATSWRTSPPPGAAPTWSCTRAPTTPCAGAAAPHLNACLGPTGRSPCPRTGEVVSLLEKASRGVTNLVTLPGAALRSPRATCCSSTWRGRPPTR